MVVGSYKNYKKVIKALRDDSKSTYHHGECLLEVFLLVVVCFKAPERLDKMVK